MSSPAVTTPEIIPDEDIDQEEALEPPYRIIVHNDDVTPFDFVIVVLVRIFGLTPLIAEHTAYTAHTTGQAYVTTLPKNEALRRVGKAHFAAQLEGYPLHFTVEPE